MSIKVNHRKTYLFRGVFFFKAAGNVGFTLIEVVISIVILSIAVGGIMAAFSAALAPRNAPLPIEITLASLFVQEKIETILADRYDPTKGFAFVQTGNYPAEGKPGGYLITTSISPWPVNPDFNTYRLVTVRVTRNGRTLGEVTTLLALF